MPANPTPSSASSAEAPKPYTSAGLDKIEAQLAEYERTGEANYQITPDCARRLLAMAQRAASVVPSAAPESAVALNKLELEAVERLRATLGLNHSELFDVVSVADVRIRRLTDELMAARALPPSEAGLVSLPVIVNTEPRQETYDPSETVASFMVRVIHKAGYRSSQAEWEMRNARGALIPQESTMGDAMWIYVSPRPGEGA